MRKDLTAGRGRPTASPAAREESTMHYHGDTPASVHSDGPRATVKPRKSASLRFSATGRNISEAVAVAR